MRRLMLLLVSAVALSLSAGCSTPQVLADEDCFTAVDALWTAVTARSPELVEKVAAELQRLRGAEKLSPEGYQALESVVKKARSVQWEPAARELKAFIQAQRRQTGP